MPRTTTHHRVTHAAYYAQVAALRAAGALKRPGSVWPQLTGGNHHRPSIDDLEQRTPTGFARLPAGGAP